MNTFAPQLDDATHSAISHPNSLLTRRRAMLIAGAIAALLLLLWLGDTLPGITPRQAVPAMTRQVGAYAVTLTLTPAQPKAGQSTEAQLRVTSGGKPVTGAQVTYAWNMVTMDMGTATGTTAATATPGVYVAHVTPLMGGYWRLTVTVRAPGQAAGTVAFDIPAHG